MKDRRGVVAGLVFVVIGAGFLLDELDVVELRPAYLLPLLLIAAGVWIVVGSARSGGRRQ
ncbi:MAG: hypothetical protein JJU45_13615 [Acidimicrobiia bacterium]|nr:hypothetical protein [Acidimicrobiia bacterium]